MCSVSPIPDSILYTLYVKPTSTAPLEIVYLITWRALLPRFSDSCPLNTSAAQTVASSWFVPMLDHDPGYSPPVSFAAPIALTAMVG